MFHWLRGWFKTADENQRLLAETHWRTALRLLDSMSYLRGAAMKVGQTLANFPDIAPREFVETLERLHYDVPPMHWSLLREMVHNELGDDPENLFAEFDKQAFAAASLGQVHRARLKTGEEVGRQDSVSGHRPHDPRGLPQPAPVPAAGPAHEGLGKRQGPVRRLADAAGTRDRLRAGSRATLQKARALFREDDGIVVPRVYPQFSTSRVLTMERLGGVHLDDFLARNPSQEERNEFARKIFRAWYRMMYAGRMLLCRLPSGQLPVPRRWPAGRDRLRLRHADHRRHLGVVPQDRPASDHRPPGRPNRGHQRMDVGDRRVGHRRATCGWATNSPTGAGGRVTAAASSTLPTRPISAAASICSWRWSASATAALGRSRPRSRGNSSAWWSLLYRLKAKIDVRAIAEEEIKATGWDRSEYAPNT